MKPQFVVAFLACLGITSCATTPTPSPEAKTVVSAHPQAQIAEGRGVISVSRDKGMMGMACKYYLYVDSVEVGFVEAGQRIEFGADPGSRVVTADVRGICGGGTSNITVDVRPGEVHYLRIGATQTGDLRFEPAAPGYR